VRVEHLAVAADVGRAINPRLCRQQLYGGALMGLAHALFDELVMDDAGRLLNGSLLTYQLPSLKDTPRRATMVLVESPHRDGPFGAKGVGESGILATAPAIGNAVRDAAGARLTRLPMTPERVLEGLEQVQA
jgi:CO/xanthine dehydrogenase Mo-binding subunit